jgi:hypothetical protein
MREKVKREIMTSAYFSAGLGLHHYDVWTQQFKPRSSSLWRLYKSVQASLFIIMTSVHISAGLVLQHYDVWIHQFRPRSSKKRKVYAWVHFIFKRRGVFLLMAILINKIHALSVLIQSSSGSAHIGVYFYSRIQPKIAVDRHMQFLRGGKGE